MLGMSLWTPSSSLGLACGHPLSLSLRHPIPQFIRDGFQKPAHMTLFSAVNRKCHRQHRDSLEADQQAASPLILAYRASQFHSRLGSFKLPLERSFPRLSLRYLLVQTIIFCGRGHQSSSRLSFFSFSHSSSSFSFLPKRHVSSVRPKRAPIIFQWMRAQAHTYSTLVFV